MCRSSQSREPAGVSSTLVGRPLVWGADDTWIPVDRAHRLAALIPGAQLHVVPRAGHLVHLDAPEALTGIVQRWLLHRAGT
jgi:pimeloyl-ACP methyl ester carboxylesterase